MYKKDSEFWISYDDSKMNAAPYQHDVNLILEVKQLHN